LSKTERCDVRAEDRGVDEEDRGVDEEDRGVDEEVDGLTAVSAKRMIATIAKDA